MKRLLALKASAGTGKTYNLALRYLALLFMGAKIENVLAITFTNKAAAEMRERVMEFLEDIQKVSDHLHDRTGLTIQEIEAKAPSVRKRFFQADIQILTMDAFIQKILRKFSYFAGIARDFDVQESEDFIPFLENLSPKDFIHFAQFAKRFEHTGEHLRDFLHLLYEKEKELPSLPSPLHDNTERVLAIYHKIVAIIEQDGTQAQRKDFSLVERVEELLYTKGGKVRSWLQKEELQEARGFKKLVQKHPDLEQMYKELKKELASYFRYQEVLFLRQLFDFYHKYRDFHYQNMQQSNHLSFIDIKHLVFKILQEDHLNRDFLYFRLDSKIEHILIDEFQDTAVEDWKIYEPLVDEIASSKTQRSFFYVGDTKQAIYGWRGGKKELFAYVARRYRMDMEELTLNYRSKSHIVEFVNELFGLHERSVQEGGYVEVSEAEEIEEELVKKLQFLFAKGVAERDIAILVYTNSDVLKVADLIEGHFGKKAVTSNSKLLIHQPRAKAVIDLIKYRYFQEAGQEILLYLYNFLSVIGRPFTPTFEQNFTSKKPIALVKEIIERYDLWDEATIELLEEAMEYKSIEEFVENIDACTKEVAFATEGIEVLTIHKSKGLAFEHVIVLDLLGKERKGFGKILFDYDGITLKGLRLNSAVREFVDPTYKNLMERLEKERMQELHNVAYVAMTRAKQSLFVIKKEKGRLAFVPTTKRGEFTISSQAKKEEATKLFAFPLRYYGAQEIVEEEDEYNPNDYAAIYKGKAYHEALEIDPAYSHSRYGFFGITKEELEKKISKARKKIEERFKGRKLKEIPFVLGKRLGIMDLLVLDGDEAVVIDYKSVKPSDEKGYIKQVNFYKEALRKFGYKKVKGYLFYLDTMKFKEV